MKKTKVVEQTFRVCDFCGTELTFPLNNGYANKGGEASYKASGMNRRTNNIHLDFCNGSATCETDWIKAHQAPWGFNFDEETT